MAILSKKGATAALNQLLRGRSAVKLSKRLEKGTEASEMPGSSNNDANEPKLQEAANGRRALLKEREHSVFTN